MISKVLLGHTSPETAYVVDDYPYGRNIRTQIRYWVEYKENKGYRFVSQTVNPKTGLWNKPKYGTYAEFAIGMYLDEMNHVQYVALGAYSSAENFESFIKNFPGIETKLLRVLVLKKIAFYRAVIKLNDEGKSAWTINGKERDLKEVEAERIQNIKETNTWEALLPLFG